MKDFLNKINHNINNEYKKKLNKNRINKTSNNDEFINFKSFDFLNNNKALLVILLTINIIGFCLSIFLINGINSLPFMSISFTTSILIFLILSIIIFICSITLIIKIKLSFKEYNVNEHGSERFTTLEEIKEQYRCIPEKNEFYEGKAGVIISKIDNNLYIDDSPVNSLYVGMTRSGKGEMFVIPLIDVYSRPIDIKNRSSMVISDPKLELFKMSKKTLEQRGYKVYCINIEDGEKSSGYNPIANILGLWERGELDDAQSLANTFSSNLFGESQGDNAIWDKTAASFLTALILAQIDDAVQMDYKLNKELLALFKVSHKEEEFIESRKNRKCVSLYSVLQFFTNATKRKIDNNGNTALDLYFKNRKYGDRASILFSGITSAGDRTKGSIYLTFSNKIMNYGLNKIAKLTAVNDIDLEEIGFGEKPIAVFLSAPDYNTSNHVIATTFISQLYYMLASLSSKGNGKCDREVVFILDEFGNMPIITNMDKLVTVCLGRNIRFNLFIQDLEQLNNLYGDNARTIRANCGNLIYILSSDVETTEEMEKLIGYKTITTVSRNGGQYSLNKSVTENYIKKPLIDFSQLKRIEKGECIVIRSMKREDLKGKSITPLPISNLQQNRLKYRFEYLQESFPNIDDIDISTIDFGNNSDINLEEYTINYLEVFNCVFEQNPSANPFYNDTANWVDANVKT